MKKIGSIPRPPDFRYDKVEERGKPEHEKTDAFSIRHPHMDIGKRAKIFAPFDALRGFSAALMEAEASAAADLPQDLSDTVMENQVRLPLHLRLSLVNDNETVPVVDVGQRRSGPDLE